MKNERELLSRSKIIYDLTKEIVENNTPANKRFFYWAYHETWMLQDFPKILASKKAYELFYNKYKRDIRNYDWFSKETTESRDNKNKRMFMHEHLTTSEDFKQELIYLYKQNKLSVEKVRDLILQQRVCWITREEDDLLRKKSRTVDVIDEKIVEILEDIIKNSTFEEFEKEREKMEGELTAELDSARVKISDAFIKTAYENNSNSSKNQPK